VSTESRKVPVQVEGRAVVLRDPAIALGFVRARLHRSSLRLAIAVMPPRGRALRSMVSACLVPRHSGCMSAKSAVSGSRGAVQYPGPVIG
jgi:hypothetical protein